MSCASRACLSCGLIVGTWLGGALPPPQAVAQTPAPKASALERDLAKIVRDLDEARAAARKRLGEQFAFALKRLPTAKVSAEQRVALVEAVRAEQERFDRHGLVPFSEPMRGDTVTYLRSLAQADAKAETAFSRLILKAEAQKDQERVQTLKMEQQRVLQPTVVARWRHQTGRNPQAIVQCLSNGRIHVADSPNTWVLTDTGRFQLRWPNPAAPRGVWVDDCQLTPDGREFRGQNQERSAAFGSYVLP